VNEEDGKGGHEDNDEQEDQEEDQEDDDEDDEEDDDEVVVEGREDDSGEKESRRQSRICDCRIEERQSGHSQTKSLGVRGYSRGGITSMRAA